MRHDSVAFRLCGGLLLVTLFAVPGGSESTVPLAWHRDATLTHSTAAADETPRWSGGALVEVEGILTASPIIRTFDREGRESTPFVFRIPDAVAIDVYSAARGGDGTLALCGVAFARDGRKSPFLTSISAGDNVLIIQASPFVPYRVAVAPDGTVWALGIEMVNGAEPEASRGKGVIRHFDQYGKELGAYIPRSGVASPATVMRGYFAAARDRVGWYLGPEGRGQYVEVTFDGTVHGFSPIPLQSSESVTGIALTDEAGTYVSTFDSTTAEGWSVFKADTSGRGWLFVERPANLLPLPWTFLHGADGNDLVFAGRGSTSISFHTATR